MKTNKSRQVEFKARMRKSGFVQVTVWIPKECKTELNVIVKVMKNEKESE